MNTNSDYQSNGQLTDLQMGDHVTLKHKEGTFFVSKVLNGERLRVIRSTNDGSGEKFITCFNKIKDVQKDPRSRPEPEPKPKKHSGNGKDEGSNKSKGSGKPKAGGAAERWKVFNNFIDFSARKLTPAEVLIWLVLFRDSKGGTASTSQRQIAKRVGKTQANVNKALKLLVTKGLVEVIRLGGYKQGTSRYRLRGLMPVE